MLRNSALNGFSASGAGALSAKAGRDFGEGIGNSSVATFVAIVCGSDDGSSSFLGTTGEAGCSTDSIIGSGSDSSDSSLINRHDLQRKHSTSANGSSLSSTGWLGGTAGCGGSSSSKGLCRLLGTGGSGVSINSSTKFDGNQPILEPTDPCHQPLSS